MRIREVMIELCKLRFGNNQLRIITSVPATFKGTTCLGTHQLFEHRQDDDEEEVEEEEEEYKKNKRIFGNLIDSIHCIFSGSVQEA